MKAQEYEIVDSVSILLAVRNEENNILRCLQSLENLDYPKGKLQILIGNDASTDKTAEIIKHFIAEKSYFQLIEIQEQSQDLKGKANVLAQLSHLATGKYFFYTDADIEVPTTWINAFLPQFTENVGVVIGCTLIEGNNVFHRCQGIEWLMALALIKQLSDAKIPVTGLGNNMAVLAEAYWKIGGYEEIGFSIVEDFALFHAIVKAKYDFKQLFQADVLAKSAPPESLYHYFHQRKRWITGALESKSALLVIGLLQAIALPILICIAFFNWQIALTLWGVQALIQSVFTVFQLVKIKQIRLIKYILPLQLYSLVFPFLVFMFLLMPIKINWKERIY